MYPSVCNLLAALLTIPCRESSRVVFIPFEPATIASGVAIDDTRLLTVLKDSGDAVSLFISLGKKFETITLEPDIESESDRMLAETVRVAVDRKLSDVFTEQKLTVNQRIRKTYTILLSFTLMVCYCASSGSFSVCMALFSWYK